MNASPLQGTSPACQEAWAGIKEASAYLQAARQLQVFTKTLGKTAQQASKTLDHSPSVFLSCMQGTSLVDQQARAGSEKLPPTCKLPGSWRSSPRPQARHPARLMTAAAAVTLDQGLTRWRRRWLCCSIMMPSLAQRSSM